jgi:hypothetical protein
MLSISDNARILYMCCTYSSSILDTDQPIITKTITYNDIHPLCRRNPKCFFTIWYINPTFNDLPEHLISSPSSSGVRVNRSVVLCVCFVDRCLSFCTFSFGHCVVCSSTYGFWLPLLYLQTLLTDLGGKIMSRKCDIRDSVWGKSELNLSLTT